MSHYFHQTGHAVPETDVVIEQPAALRWNRYDDSVSYAGAAPSQPQATPQVRPNPLRANEGAMMIEMTATGPVLTEHAKPGSAWNLAADIAERANNTSVIGTARSAAGSPRSGLDIQPTDIVSINGSDTSVAAAEKMGLIRRNEFGAYVDVEGAADSLLAEPEAAELEGFANEAVDEVLTAYVDTLPEPVQMAAAEEVMRLEGELSQKRAEEIGAMLGVHSSQVSEHVGAIYAAYTDQARSALEGMGVNFDSFSEWANSTPALRQELMNAVRGHVYGRLTRHYADLAHKFQFVESRRR